MSSVLDQHDSYRQENRDFNEAPMRIEPKVALSDAGGNEDVKIANGHQESKSGARHLLDDDEKEQERSMEGNISKEDNNGNCSPPAGRPRSNSRSVSPSASRQESPPAASRSPDASMSRSRSRSRSPVDCGRKPRSPGHSRSRTPSPSKRRGSYTPSHSRSRSRSADRRRPFSRSRSKTPDRRRRRGSPPPRRRGSSPVHRRRRSPSRSISRERDYRRRDRSRDRSRDRGRVERGSRLARPDVSQYRKPEKWLYNLFEDALKETLESTRLPCNVSKINDCMRRLDPTYRLDETEFPSFSVMCHWFDDMENLLEVSKQRDSIMLTGSRLESQVVKRLRSPIRGPPRGPRNRRRGRRIRSPPPRRRMRSRSPDRRDGGGRGGRRGGDSRSRSPDRRGGRGRGDDEDRWEME